MSGRLIIAGGGTGGHIFPGLAVAKELAQMDIEVCWLGLEEGREASWVPAQGIPFSGVSYDRPAGWLGYVGALAKARPAVTWAREILSDFDAHAVLALGGYPSLPGAFAAVTMRLPLLIHEQNRKLGLANRLLSPVAKQIMTSFAGTFRAGRAELTGNPVRAEFTAIPPPEERWRGRTGPLRIVVLGGSAGADALNAALPVILGDYSSERKIVVVHQTGEAKVEWVAEAYRKHGITAEVLPFIDDVAVRLADADLVIGRAGAGAIAELTCVGVPSILVPYVHARGHQAANAEVLEQAKAAIVVPEPVLMGGDAMRLALNAIGGRLSLLARAQAARTLGRPQAAAAVAECCWKLVG